MPGISVKLPLKQDEVDGLYQMNKTLTEVTQQDLKMLFLTSPGERILIPNYGVGLKRFLFENSTNVEALQHEIISIAIEQVQTWMPYVELKHFDFNYSEGNNPHLLGLSVHYTNNPLGLDGVLEIDGERT